MAGHHEEVNLRSHLIFFLLGVVWQGYKINKKHTQTIRITNNSAESVRITIIGPQVGCQESFGSTLQTRLILTPPLYKYLLIWIFTYSRLTRRHLFLTRNGLHQKSWPIMAQYIPNDGKFPTVHSKGMTKFDYKPGKW